MLPVALCGFACSAGAQKAPENGVETNVLRATIWTYLDATCQPHFALLCCVTWERRAVNSKALVRFVSLNFCITPMPGCQTRLSSVALYVWLLPAERPTSGLHETHSKGRREQAQLSESPAPGSLLLHLFGGFPVEDEPQAR